MTIWHLRGSFNLHREQTVLKRGLILHDDHPDWTATFKDNSDLESVQGLKYIGGVDLSFIVGNKEDAIASLVVLSYPELQVRQNLCRGQEATGCF